MQGLNTCHGRMKCCKLACMMLVTCLVACSERPKPPVEKDKTVVQKSIGGLGTLLPKGHFRTLRPNGLLGSGTQVVERLFVEEGQRVVKGQTLVTLRNYHNYLEQRRNLKKIIAIHERQLRESSKLLKTFGTISNQGGYPITSYQQRVIAHQGIISDLHNAKNQLETNTININNSIINSPVDGYITAIYSREGEDTSKNGILQVGDLSELYAQLEVYESDIRFIKPGQTVEIRSESGSFAGIIKGKVINVIPGIRARTTIPTQAVPNVDVRVGVIQVSIPRNDATMLRKSVGTKLLGKIIL